MAFVEYLSDNGTAITSEIEFLRDYLGNLGDPDDEKMLKYLYVWATPISTLKFFISYDDGDYEYLGGVDEYPKRFDLGHTKCKHIKLKATESSTNKPFIVEAYMIIGDKVQERE